MNDYHALEARHTALQYRQQRPQRALGKNATDTIAIHHPQKHRSRSMTVIKRFMSGANEVEASMGHKLKLYGNADDEVKK